MKKAFVCSLCHSGILGGMLYLDKEKLVYRTNKLTVDQKYRNLVMPLKNIKEISWQWIILPIATVKMTTGRFFYFSISALKIGRLLSIVSMLTQ